MATWLQCGDNHIIWLEVVPRSEACLLWFFGTLHLSMFFQRALVLGYGVGMWAGCGEILVLI